MVKSGLDGPFDDGHYIDSNVNYVGSEFLRTAKKSRTLILVFLYTQV